MNKQLTIAALLSVAASSLAGGLGTPTPAPAPVEIKPEMICQIDADGNQIGPWIMMNDGNETPQVQAFDRSYDFRHMVADGSASSNNIYHPTVYGGGVIFTSATPVAGTLVSYPWQVNDMDMVAGKQGIGIERNRQSIVWAPAGGTLTTGFVFNPNANLYRMAVDTWHMGKWFDGTNGFIWKDLLTGYRAVFGTAAAGQAPGFFILNTTWTEASGISWPTPATNDGGYMTIVRKMDTAGVVSNLVVANNEVAAHGFRTTCAPTDTLFPGTNPSDSTNACWIDTNADYTLAATEIFDMTDPTFGNLQPIQSGFHDMNHQLATGTVMFQDLADPVGNYPSSVDVDVQACDGTGTPISGVFRQVTYGVSDTGAIKISNPLLIDPGTTLATSKYIFSFKRTHWLRANTDVYDYAAPAAFTESLINGDVDNDNEVGPGDFGALSAAFGSVDGDSNWNAMADLDEDGEVGPSDFGILSANFGEAGDEDFTP